MRIYNKNTFKYGGSMRIILLILFLSIVTGAGTSFAQPKDGKFDGKDDRKDFREKIQKLRKEKLIEKLNISETTADKVFEMEGSMVDEIREYQKEKRETFKEIENNPDATDIDSKLNRILDLDIKTAEAKKSYYTNLKEILTPKQIAEAMVLQMKFNKKLREQFKKKRKNKGDKKKGRFDGSEDFEDFKGRFNEGFDDDTNPEDKTK